MISRMFTSGGAKNVSIERELIRLYLLNYPEHEQERMVYCEQKRLFL